MSISLKHGTTQLVTLIVLFTCLKATIGIKRENRGRGGLWIFVQDNLCMKVWDDLNDISDAVKYLSVVIENELSKNVILRLDYRTPKWRFPIIWKTRNVFPRNGTAKKNVKFAGNINITILGFKRNKKVNYMFIFGMISTVNKSTGIARRTATTAFDQVFWNAVLNGLL